MVHNQKENQSIEIINLNNLNNNFINILNGGEFINKNLRVERTESR